MTDQQTEFAWACTGPAGKHASTRTWADRDAASKAARNHRSRNHGSRACRANTCKVHQVAKEVAA